MPSGLDIALGEITLVLFTTLAPSGVVAFILMGLPLLRGGLDDGARKRVNQFLSIPLVVSMAGLVASATHLGNPANALYVFAGVGRSPLSTEVFCAVVFLMLAGVYWLYSFAVRPRAGLQRIWMALAMLAGVAFVTAVAFAYRADTIVSWNSPLVPLNLWLNALVGGPILAFFSLRAAGCGALTHRYGRVLAGLALAALAANAAGFALQGAELAQTSNSLTDGLERVPFYGAMMGVFAALCLAGALLDARALRRASKAESAGHAADPSLLQAGLAVVLVLAGIFVMRFAFYMMHLTVGVGL